MIEVEVENKSRFCYFCGIRNDFLVIYNHKYGLGLCKNCAIEVKDELHKALNKKESEHL